ncbi:uncharacterized protein LOC110700143 isoform X3 [Chenopodium quinoa]|uniref:uncharacterized protein LOC110700143 isoform X3 n=1 Tax=Chenopodium quinoa TaxID=63459 RepID=UPI000B7876C4|nr:uncharacterized protein LOC110700143 isoform X3 [Chenopodium quinoa]
MRLHMMNCSEYVCKCIKSNKSRMQEIPELHQVVADYCFLKNKSMKSEQLIAFEAPIAIPRDDMITLAPTVPNQLINSSIVQAWSFLMNKSSLMAKPSCLFFGIDHNRPLKISLASQKTSQEAKDRSPKSVLAGLSQTWLDWLQLCNVKDQFMGVDLVFQIPKFLKKRKHPKAEEMLNFNLGLIELPFLKSRQDNYSGSYLFPHMKAYDGINGLGLGSIKDCCNK